MAKKKVIEVYNHPYMFKVEVEFGTFEEMIAKRYRYQTFNGGQVFIGGTFNEKMNDTSKASLIELAVEFDFDTFHRDENGGLHFDNVSSPKGISYSRWEGTYCYCPSWFDEEMKQGLFPVKANWDGVTYIERGEYVNHKYVPRYERTDTYRY